MTELAASANARIRVASLRAYATVVATRCPGSQPYESASISNHKRSISALILIRSAGSNGDAHNLASINSAVFLANRTLVACRSSKME